MSRMAVFSFFAIACANAFSAQMASQQWVMNRIEEATNNISGASGYATIEEVNAKISTNNAAFVSAVLAVPLTGADAGDLKEIAEYGGYGTVGAALLALIAGLAALKRRVTSAETAIAQKASLTDLPYALITLGGWEFSGVPSGVVPTMEWNSYWILNFDGWQVGGESGSETDTEVAFSVEYGGQTYLVTATRNVLHDRAGNRVVVSGDTTLTLPAAVPGYLRDFLVRLEISGSTVPTITFQGQGSEAPNGADEITYETDGDEFPVPDEAGSWLYSFTESCVAHTFAVSLKQVQTVVQGGA